MSATVLPRSIAVADAPKYEGGPPLGVVPHASAARHQQAGMATPNMTYHGGSIMKKTAVHAIFWDPSNGTNTNLFPAGYVNAIGQYFLDVATDSGNAKNVYSTATQYSGPPGTYVNYNVTPKQLLNDVDPYPSSGCTPGSGFLGCVTDEQIRAELAAFIPNVTNPPQIGLQHIWFMFLPYQMDVCHGGGQCFSNSFCAYHSWFKPVPNAKHIIYAVQPFEYQGDCRTKDEEPVGFYADDTINGVSHEHNEAITDPTGEAWFAGSLSGENGDLCSFQYSPLSGTSPAKYNQKINGHHYLLQKEWSNRSHGCLQRGT